MFETKETQRHKTNQPSYMYTQIDSKTTNSQHRLVGIMNIQIVGVVNHKHATIEIMMNTQHVE